jgi:ERCC4-type nuclease
MLIRVDMRETELFGMFQMNLVGTTHKLQSESLPVGDVILSSADGKTNYIVFERKSLADLAASIRDGRYKEQSLRLQAFPNVHHHNIVYIVEGDFSRYNERFSKIGKGALQSAMCSLNYYKGFSVVRTMSIMETYEIIHSYANKLAASPAPYGHYHHKPASTNEGSTNEGSTNEGSTNEGSTNEGSTNEGAANEGAANEGSGASNESTANPSYCSVLNVKQVKCENITPQNIGEIMLCNIPGVSNKTAAAVMKKYATLRLLMDALADCKSGICLADIRLETQRKLSKQCIQNIYNFLMA